VELVNIVGCSDIIERIVDDLKDDSEPHRRMVMEALRKVFENLGAADIDERLEERLIDGILSAFQEQAVATTNLGSREGQIMLDVFGTVVQALGERCHQYLKQIAGTIKWRLNNKASSVRMQVADLISRTSIAMKKCGEDQLMGHLGVVLYEYLGEEYPEVLGSTEEQQKEQKQQQSKRNYARTAATKRSQKQIQGIKGLFERHVAGCFWNRSPPRTTRATCFLGL